MKLGKAGADLMHQWEGYRTKPYLCPAHIWTIGYGHVLYQDQIRLPVVRVEGKETPMIRKEMPLKPEDNRVWTKEEIEKLFEDDVGPTERGVLRLAPLYLVVKALSTRVSVLPLTPEWGLFSVLLFG